MVFVGLGLLVIVAMAVEAVLSSVEKMRQDKAAEDGYNAERQSESIRFQRR